MMEERNFERDDRLPETACRVLVVDDSLAQRRMLRLQLERWGYEVVEAETGEAALALAVAGAFDIVLSDWVMPGMSGLELCRAFRALPRETYSYFILLTSKTGSTEIATGLEGGADDYLAKPVNFEELRARLRVGERIIGMQGELLHQNRRIEETYEQLQGLYDSLDRDLVEARKLQRSLMQDRKRQFGRCEVSAVFRPSGRVGGDLVGSFRINADQVAFYSLDVSGHGLASAMMTARLSGLLSGDAPGQNMALSSAVEGDRRAWPPEVLAARLNRMMTEDLKVEQYFTMVYAEIDLPSGVCNMVQAGHPHPLLIRQSGEIEVLGQGGMPIGLVEEAEYVPLTVGMRPGDRLFLGSDGITECPDPAGKQFAQERLVGLLSHNAGLKSPKLLQAMLWGLGEFAGSGGFPDDVSAVIFDYTPPARVVPVRRQSA